MLTHFLRGVVRREGRTFSPRRSRIGAFRSTRSMALESLEDRRLLATVSGQKFHDIDMNAEKDPGEPGLNGWTIELRDTLGELLTSTTTADSDLDGDGQIDPETESGLYGFTDVAAGTYVVREVLQEGWGQTTSDPLANQAWALDQELGLFIDFGYNLNWGGRNEKWMQSANVQTPEGKNQWYYILPNGEFYQWDNQSGTPMRAPLNGTLVATFTTTFWETPSLLHEAQPAGSHIVTVNGGSAQIDFGNSEVSSLHGRKWHDLNTNGTRDADEPFLNGWTIELLDEAGSVVATTTTMDMDVDGSGDIDPETESGLYWFDGLLDGSYTVREVLPEGWMQTAPVGDLEFTFPLGEDQENPPTGSQATGSCTAVLRADHSSFQVDCTHDVVEATDAHIHRGAVGVNGPVIIGFASGESPLSLTWDAGSTPPLTAGDVADLLAGDLYVNVHSVTFPPGEIRGQIPAGTPSGDHNVTVAGGERVEGLDFGNYQEPLTVDIVDVEPNPRAEPVDSITIVFSDPVDGFDMDDIQLMRVNDSMIDIPLDSATLTTADNITWTLGSLGDSTATAGIYTLTLDAASAGIAHATNGNALVTSAVSQWINGPGDADLNGMFDQLDVVLVLQIARYLAGPPANWGEGDWNGNDQFEETDLDAAIEPEHYLQGPFDTPDSTPASTDAADMVFDEMGTEGTV